MWLSFLCFKASFLAIVLFVSVWLCQLLSVLGHTVLYLAGIIQAVGYITVIVIDDDAIRPTVRLTSSLSGR